MAYQLLPQIPYNANVTYVKVKDYDGAEGYIALYYKDAVDRAVPWAWSHLFCNCYSDGAGEIILSGNGERSYRDECRKCGRRPRWQLVYCVKCEELKPWVFIHHQRKTAWHPGQGLGTENPFNKVPEAYRHVAKAFCWDCLVSAYGTIEGDVPPPADLVPRKALSAEEFMADTTDPFDGFDF